MTRRPRARLLLGAAGVAGTAIVLDRLARAPMVRFARMAGSSIAAPDAAGWITDFLNAAYYRRPPGLREVNDLRLAFCIVTTYWHRAGHRRLRGWDVLPFHRAFGTDRFLDNRRSDRLTLNRDQLLGGRRACSAPGSPTPTPIPRGGAGVSLSKRRTSARRTTRRIGCAARGCAS